MSLQIFWSISAQCFGSLWSPPNLSPIRREKQEPEKHQVLSSSHSPLAAEPQWELDLQPPLLHSARRLPAHHSRSSRKRQHAVKHEILSYVEEKSPEMTRGLYDSACAVKHGEIMGFCLLVGLFWFGVWEREKPRYMTPVCGGAGSVLGKPLRNVGKGVLCSGLGWEVRVWGPGLSLHQEKNGTPRRLVAIISPSAR